MRRTLLASATSVLLVALLASHGSAAVVGIIGTNSATAIQSLLQTAGHTVNLYSSSVPPAGTLATLDVVFLLRTQGNPDLESWVLGGGRLVTEWDATNWALNTASLLPASDSGGGYVGTGTPITFTNPGDPLSTGVTNPYSDGNRTEFFRNLTGIGAGADILATRGANVPCILGGQSGAGSTLCLAYDWADGFGSANADSRQLILNAVMWTSVSPPPTCTLTEPPPPASADVEVTLDAATASSPTVDALFEFSLDAGVTYTPCSAAVASAVPNPALGIPTGVTIFTWDSRADGVALATLQAGVLVRATVDDPLAQAPGDCTTAPFDVDNSMFCNGTCGDCNLDASPAPDILDALVAAQIGALVLLPSAQQGACCDVNDGGTVDVIDALLIAQSAALIPVTLTCP